MFTNNKIILKCSKQCQTLKLSPQPHLNCPHLSKLQTICKPASVLTSAVQPKTKERTQSEVRGLGATFWGKFCRCVSRTQAPSTYNQTLAQNGPIRAKWLLNPYSCWPQITCLLAVKRLTVEFHSNIGTLNLPIKMTSAYLLPA